MAERTLPGLGLTGFWPLGADGWKDEMDENLRILSGVSQLSVLSQTTALPGSPTNGDIYIVPDDAPSFGGQVAIRDDGAWVNYRAALRDLPKTTRDPNSPVWPTPPI